MESDIEAPLPPPPTEAASRRIASIALMRRAAADSAAQRALYGSRRSSAGAPHLSLMPGSARSSHNSSIANLEGSGRDRRAYQNAVSAVMPSGPRVPQTPFEVLKFAHLGNPCNRQVICSHLEVQHDPAEQASTA